MTEHSSSNEVSATHPCIAGHFPGNPVVPAVLLLQQVLDAVQAWRGSQWQLRRVVAAKFLRPLRPGEPFEIAMLLAGTRVDFRCERNKQILAQGTLEITQQGLSVP